MNIKKTLWFSNILFPAVAEQLGVPVAAGGTWMVDLAKQLTTDFKIQLTIVTSSSRTAKLFKHVDGGITYIVVPFGRQKEMVSRAGLSGFEPLLAALTEVVEQEEPDVVVVHGTEFVYGLVAKRTKVPFVISLQGVAEPYVDAFWGELRQPFRRLRFPRQILACRQLKYQAKLEAEIFKSNRFFIGRTFWDQSQLFRHAPNAYYFFEPHVLRPDFLQNEWKLDDVDRHSIYTTTTPQFRKGTSLLLEGVALAKRIIPDIKVRIGGPIGQKGVSKFIRDRVRQLGLQDTVEFLGYVDGSQIAEHLKRCHAYVLPSFIENSPQTLAEAQAVGTPSIAGNVGGIPSMIHDGVDGLLFNVGDAAVLAKRILQVFQNDELAKSLSTAARRLAADRHDAKKVAVAHINMCNLVFRSRDGEGLDELESRRVSKTIGYV